MPPVGWAAATPVTTSRRRRSCSGSASRSTFVVGEARRVVVEIGDQCSTSWPLLECGMTGVADAEVPAGTVDARTVVDARAGKTRSDVGLRNRIFKSGGRPDCS